jgi:SnoaL-like domain
MDPRDEMGVRQLVGRYCDAVARFDAALYGSLWTEDAVWASGERAVESRDAIVKVYGKARARYALCVQQILSGFVEDGRPGDGPGALRATWQVREVQWPHEGDGVELYGAYHDVCVPGPSPTDGWRFAVRRFEAFYRGPLAVPGTVLGPPTG